jgi:DnaK suppressor protein
MVDGALGRMDDGSYGQSCGQEISPKRLHAVPWTHYCIECQQKAEEDDGELNSAVG